jgi:hypothetical protein
MADPLGGANGDLGVPSVNAKKMSMEDPLGGADGDSGAPTINAKKCQWWAPWKRCRRFGRTHHQS